MSPSLQRASDMSPSLQRASSLPAPSHAKPDKIRQASSRDSSPVVPYRKRTLVIEDTPLLEENSQTPKRRGSTPKSPLANTASLQPSRSSHEMAQKSAWASS